MTIGDLRFTTQFTVPRCVMTIQAQEDLCADRDVLRTITKLSRVELHGEKYPCLGLYAQPVDEGTVRVGDPVVID